MNQNNLVPAQESTVGLCEIFVKVFLLLLLWHSCQCQRGMSANRKKRKDGRGTFGARHRVKLPRNASVNQRRDLNLLMKKDSETIRKYGTGYRCMWEIKACRKLMIKSGFKPPGEYDPNNGVDGKFFATKKEAEFLDGPTCGDILFLAYDSKATESQLQGISKCFSWGFQLKTGKEGNFQEVTDQWNQFNKRAYGPPTQHLKAEVCLPPELVKIAMTTEWKPDCGSPYPEWNVRYLLGHDYLMLGSRRKEDLKRIRDSREHDICPEAGYVWTQMVGGRCKQSKNYQIKEWRAWRACSCPGGKHQGLPFQQYKKNRELFDRKGNPKNMSWCSSCPLTCFEVVQHFLVRSGKPAGRCYPKWSNVTHQFGVQDVAEMKLALEAHEFIRQQGANPNNLKLHTNSGRKSLGMLCDRHDVSEEDSFPYHGNQCKNWRVYQESVKRVPTHTTREQPLDPTVALKGHRKILQAWGRGPPVPKPEVPVSRAEFEAANAATRAMFREIMTELKSRK